MLNRIGSPQSSTYRYPAMCCRCGSPEPTTTGLVMKSMHNRIIRFIWEKVETFTLTVPACTACKMFLDTHTYRAGLASIGGYMLGASVALFLAYPWLEWFFLSNYSGRQAGRKGEPRKALTKASRIEMPCLRTVAM